MPWFAVHTKPRQEAQVSSRLADDGIAVFLPLIQLRRKRRGRGTSRVEPLFPRYLFVDVSSIAPAWSAVRWTPGVTAVLGCDGVPSPVPDRAVALIKERIGADGVITPQPSFMPGDRIRVTSGPFVGLVGILERGASRSGRVQVLLDMLRGATVELEDVDVELAG